MTYSSILVNLYFLLIHADGKVDEKEIAFGRTMVNAEGLNMDEFNVQMIMLRSKDAGKLLADNTVALKKLAKEDQVRIIAWLCVVANADGFMDRAEWQFIYKLYHYELHLPLDEIMNHQKELSRLYRQQVVSSLAGVAIL